MTEKQTPSKRLEEKVDILTENFYEMQGDIKVILQRLEMQPKIDQQSFDGLKQASLSCQTNANVRFNAVESRTHKLEENQTWIARTVIGQVILLLFGIIATFYQFTKGL